MTLWQVHCFDDDWFVEADSLADAVESVLEHFNRETPATGASEVTDDDIESIVLLSRAEVIRR